MKSNLLLPAVAQGKGLNYGEADSAVVFLIRKVTALLVHHHFLESTAEGCVRERKALYGRQEILQSIRETKKALSDFRGVARI